MVNKYNSTYQSAIKVKPVDVNSSTYIYFGIKNNEKYPKFKVVDHVRISKFNNIFATGYHLLNYSVFVIKKVKNTVSWTYNFNNLNCEETVGTFYEKELQKTNQKKFRVEKEIKYLLNGKTTIILSKLD